VTDDTARGARFLGALHELVSVAFADDLATMLADLARDYGQGALTSQQVVDRLTPIRGALLGRLQRAVERPTLPALRALWTVAQYAPGDGLRADVERLARAWRAAATERQRRKAVAELCAWFATNARTFGSVALRGPF